MEDISIEIEGDSEPAVALALLRIVMRAEGKDDDASADWILATYARCLATVLGEDAATVAEDDEADADEDEGDTDDSDDEARPARATGA
jgi:hypothetical protein